MLLYLLLLLLLLFSVEFFADVVKHIGVKLYQVDGCSRLRFDERRFSSPVLRTQKANRASAANLISRLQMPKDNSANQEIDEQRSEYEWRLITHFHLRRRPGASSSMVRTEFTLLLQLSLAVRPMLAPPRVGCGQLRSRHLDWTVESYRMSERANGF